MDSVAGKIVLVQGGAGATAVQLAHQAAAHVIATVRSESATEIALRMGAHEVLVIDENLVERIKELAPEGVDHIVEAAFDTNINMDLEILAQGSSIAAYATNVFTRKFLFGRSFSVMPAFSLSAATTCRQTRKGKPPARSIRHLRRDARG